MPLFTGQRKLLSKEEVITLETPSPAFIPYACHYDPHTILTKNGEILQIIKIVGFSHEVVGSDYLSLREMVRKAVLDNVKTDNFSLCFHTVRRKKDLDPAGSFDNKFSQDLHDAWCQKNYWHDKYVNELYVTVIHEGMLVRVTSPRDFLDSLSFRRQKRRHDKHLAQACERLNVVVDNMLKTLTDFGAKRLTIVEDQNGIYSEPLQFFGKIIHLSEKEMPVPVMDLSEYLATQKIAFGNNTLEVHSQGGKYFAGIFSIKEYVEIPAKAMDQFLQLPLEFIVTQTMDFINSKRALKEFEYQDYILQVSGDEEFRKLSGLGTVLKANQGLLTDFGESQLTIMVFANELRKLEEDLKRSATALAKLGLVFVREDLFLEQCYWSQLPANFAFITRKRQINTSRVGGFASLHNFPAGNRFNNQWGPAVTLFRTMASTPYFFNFHLGKQGNTLIVGPRSAGRTELLHFLLSEARKFGGKLFLLSKTDASETFTRAMGGAYQELSPKPQGNQVRCNPFSIPLTPAYEDFLLRWLDVLLPTKQLWNEEVQTLLREVLHALYALPESERRFTGFIQELGKKEGTAWIIEQLKPWYGEGNYAQLFDNHGDTLIPEDNRMVTITLPDLQDVHAYAVIVMYCLHRIEQHIQGGPNIVVVDDAWEIFDNALFGPHIASWLAWLDTRNAIAILATDDVAKSKGYIPQDLMKHIATQIFLPNPDAPNSYREICGLSAQEFALLSSMKVINRHFLLKQGNDAIVAELNLTGIDQMLALLSGGGKARTLMQEAMKEAGESPDDWLPVFYSKCT